MTRGLKLRSITIIYLGCGNNYTHKISCYIVLFKLCIIEKHSLLVIYWAGKRAETDEVD